MIRRGALRGSASALPISLPWVNYTYRDYQYENSRKEVKESTKSQEEQDQPTKG